MEVVQKVKRVMTPELKAKMAAGRARVREERAQQQSKSPHIDDHQYKEKMPSVDIRGDRPSIELLKSLNWDLLSYEELAGLMPALRETWESAAQALQRKQSLMEASNRKVPCSTCGALVDITQSGKFQQKTVRDPVTFNPMNVYFCSQGCIQGYEAKLQRDHVMRTRKSQGLTA